jgi:predicted 2-oxoglutarate/Fe(II)-dependent dioxygenase YbiX
VAAARGCIIAAMSARLCSYESKPSVFTPEECERIRALGSGLGLGDATTHDDSRGVAVTTMKRNCKVVFVKAGTPQWGWVFDRINEHAHGMNKARWDFDVQDIEDIQYTSYGMGEFYATHFDNGSKQTPHRKLSISVQLTPPREYVGGALRFWSMNDRPTAGKDQGSMTCFPSYLMHVAKPVWWGRREVLVTWMHGLEKLR